ncbi:MAG: hypothetical protein R6V13_04605 [Anaerolineae bacterium]
MHKRIWATRHTDFGWQSRFYDCIIGDEEMLWQARDRDNLMNLYVGGA